MNQELINKQLAFLEEGVAYYSENPKERRCITNSQSGGFRCTYSPATIGNTISEGCFIGRKLPSELALKLDYMAPSKTFSDVFDLFPNDLKELGIDFLTDCQVLHDKSVYWTNTGLSELGDYAYERLKENVIGGHYEE